jgi:hypothetical protein
MRRYGPRVTVRAASWTTEDFSATEVFARREQLLDAGGP